MDDPTNRPSGTPDGRASLSAMARAQRSTPSQPPPPPNRKSNVPDSPFVSDPTEGMREALPPPYEDASGFIDLDKLRAEAAAQAAARPPSFAPPPPAHKGARTPPPVAASIFATPEPTRSGPSQTMGMIIGGSIAAAGLVAAFFIVSRGNSAHETRTQSAAQRPVAMNAPAPAAQPPATAVAQPIANPQPAAAAPTIAPAAQPAAPAAPVAAAPNAAAEPDPAAAPAHAAAAPRAATAPAAPRVAAATEAPAAAPAREPSTIDSTEQAGKGKGGKGAGKVAARGAKSETPPKADAPAYEVPKEAPAAAGNSFLQTLGKTPELAAQAAAAPPAAAPAPAAEPAPTPPALPAPSKEKPGLASAIQKAGTAQEAPPPAAAAPAAAAPKAAAAPAAAAPAAPAPVVAPAAGVPETPSSGAIASAVRSGNTAAKACVKGQEAPSRANITWGSDGKVQSVSVSGPAVGTPAEQCIKQALQNVNVGPFSRPSYSQSVPVRP